LLHRDAKTGDEPTFAPAARRCFALDFDHIQAPPLTDAATDRKRRSTISSGCCRQNFMTFRVFGNSPRHSRCRGTKGRCLLVSGIGRRSRSPTPS
jgi:hypothetical protein